MQIKHSFFKIPILLLSLLLGAHTQAKITACIFDMGDVLVEPDHMTKGGQIGFGNCIDYLCSGGKKEDIKLRMYDVLIHAGGPQQGDPALWARDYNGDPLPQIFLEWQLGVRSTHEVKELANSSLKILNQLGFFKNKPEYRCVKNLINYGVFDADGLAEGMKYSKPGCKLLEKLSKETNEDGTPRYTFYILSNWDPESFTVLYEQKKLQEKIFSYVAPEHIMISGDHHLAKPDPKFFELLCSKYDLNPEECLFFDDRTENIVTAQQLGFSTVQWDMKQAKKIIRDLKKEEILSKK